MHRGLPEFIRKIKQAGFLVKLDTNGSSPRMLKQLIDNGLLDYISMDIKAPLERYAEVANAPVDLKDIEQSIDLIRNSGIEYEFRTTILPRLVSESDLIKIGKWLKGSRRYAIQQFRPLNTLDPSYRKESPYNKEDLQRFKKLLEPYFDEVEVRGN